MWPAHSWGLQFADSCPRVWVYRIDVRTWYSLTGRGELLLF